MTYASNQRVIGVCLQRATIRLCYVAYYSSTNYNNNLTSENVYTAPLFIIGQPLAR